MGCASGMANEAGGCYGDCYAANASRRYGYDFSRSVLRSFESERQRRAIVSAINRIPLDFVRIGSSGDPSEDWAHTISILRMIDKCNKRIVIITRHWTALTDEQLAYFGTINVVVNTSVSALDKTAVREHCVSQYNRLKPWCKSIVSGAGVAGCHGLGGFIVDVLNQYRASVEPMARAAFHRVLRVAVGCSVNYQLALIAVVAVDLK